MVPGRFSLPLPKPINTQAIKTDRKTEGSSLSFTAYPLPDALFQIARDLKRAVCEQISAHILSSRSKCDGWEQPSDQLRSTSQPAFTFLSCWPPT